MMPYIQGDPDSVPAEYQSYREVIETVYLDKGSVGFLTIDESPVKAGTAHRGDRAKYGRALHTEAGWRPHSGRYVWGGGGWGNSPAVTLAPETEILIANNIDKSCAIWNAIHFNTSDDGDIGHQADMYPYDDAIFLTAGEVYRIGILTPHESLPIDQDCDRQFLRIVGSQVTGRESYFTLNPLVSL